MDYLNAVVTYDKCFKVFEGWHLLLMLKCYLPFCLFYFLESLHVLVYFFNEGLTLNLFALVITFKILKGEMNSGRRKITKFNCSFVSYSEPYLL